MKLRSPSIILPFWITLNGTVAHRRRRQAWNINILHFLFDGFDFFLIVKSFPFRRIVQRSPIPIPYSRCFVFHCNPCFPILRFRYEVLFVLFVLFVLIAHAHKNRLWNYAEYFFFIFCSRMNLKSVAKGDFRTQDLNFFSRTKQLWVLLEYCPCFCPQTQESRHQILYQCCSPSWYFNSSQLQLKTANGTTGTRTTETSKLLRMEFYQRSHVHMDIIVNSRAFLMNREVSI